MNGSRWAGCAALCAVGAASLAGFGCGRQAESPPATASDWREFEGAWNATGTRRTIPLGEHRTGAIIDLGGTMLLSGEGRPGVGFRAEMIGLVDSEAGLVGRGVWTDERGDEVFCEFTGEGTKESNHIVGTLLGGTGRFRGAMGTFEFSWQFVLEGEDGSIQGRAKGLKGRFKIGDRASEVGR